MIAAIAGFVLVIPMIVFVRARQWESWFFTSSLIGLPLVYVIFGLFADGDNVVVNEILYGLPFFIMGIFLLVKGFRLSAYVVAAFWFIHAVYDLVHNSLFINDAVFSWYPVFCAVFDLSVSIYLIYLALNTPNSNIKLVNA